MEVNGGEWRSLADTLTESYTLFKLSSIDKTIDSGLLKIALIGENHNFSL